MLLWCWFGSLRQLFSVRIVDFAASVVIILKPTCVIIIIFFCAGPQGSG